MRQDSSHPVSQHEQTTLSETSAEGSLAFTLMARASGLHVERLRQRADKGRATHNMSFATEASFVKWCMADRLQFEYPLLYAKLRRFGCALLSKP